MTLPGTHHLKFIDATVSTSYVCEVHGHIRPEQITAGEESALACPHCLEEMDYGEALQKPEIIKATEVLPPKRMALLPASSLSPQQGSFACPWCREKFPKYWDLREHQEICPAIVMCTTEKCTGEVIGRCVVCRHTYCGEHMNLRGVCDFCEEFSTPS